MASIYFITDYIVSFSYLKKLFFNLVWVGGEGERETDLLFHLFMHSLVDSSFLRFYLFIFRQRGFADDAQPKPTTLAY